jgi:hypothetical protein
MLRFSMASASGGGYFGRKLRTNRLKFSYSCRCASVAMVSKTIDDLPEPETPGEDGDLPLRDPQRNVFEVVLAGAADLDVFRHGLGVGRV